jgi:hypothetical protein
MLSFLIGESETSVWAAMVAMLCLCEDDVLWCGDDE